MDAVKVMSALSAAHGSILDDELGLKEFAHSIEGYTASLARPLTDAIHLRVIELLGRFLLRAYANGTHAETRHHIMLASMMAGVGFPNSGLGAVHGLTLPLGGHFCVAHGVANPIMLPCVMGFNLPRCAEKLGDLAIPLGVKKRDAEAAIEQVFALRRALKLPVPPSYSISSESLPILAREALGKTPTASPIRDRFPKPRRSKCIKPRSRNQPHDAMKGYSGKILHVDLSSGALSLETPSESFYRTYIGGACMGAKNLRGIAVRGTGKPEYADPGAIQALSRSAAAKMREEGFFKVFKRLGTLMNMEWNTAIGGRPTRNWTMGTFSETEKLFSSSYADTMMSKSGTCWACVQSCKRQIRDGITSPRAARIPLRGPECETVGMTGPHCCVSDWNAIATTIGLVIECHEKGLITKSDLGGLEAPFGSGGSTL
jgi:hypothetical protein